MQSRAVSKLLQSAGISLVLITSPVLAQTNTFPLSGYVGIGTTTPSNALDVIGGVIHSDTALIAGDAYWASQGFSHLALTTYGSADILGNILSPGSVTIGTWSPSAPTSGLYVAGNIDAGGDVGIGTVSPNSLLSLGPAQGIKELVYDGNVNYNVGIGVDLVPGMNSLDIFSGYGTGGNTAINFVMPTGPWPYGGYSPKMTILESGDVGIGTTTPTASLAVYAATPSTSANLMLISGQDRTPRIQFNGPWSISNPNQSYAQIAAVNDNGGPGTSAASLHFYTSSGDPAALTEKMMITGTGYVGIGTSNPAYPLSVNGTVEAKEILVQTGWSDFVFGKDYALMPLAQVKARIQADHHLPDMPSAQEVAVHGVSVGEMEAKLLQKIEELTIYTIKIQEQNEELQTRLAALEEIVSRTSGQTAQGNK